MDRDDEIIEQLQTTNKILATIIIPLLTIIAIGAFFAGRGAVIEHGIGRMLGF